MLFNPFRVAGTLRAPYPRASPGVMDGLSPLGYVARSNRNFTSKCNRSINEKLLAPLLKERGREGEVS